MKEAVARGAARVGRDPAEVELACYLPTSVSEDVDAAKLAAKYDVAIHMSSYHYYRTYFNRRGKGHIAGQVAARVDAGDMEAAVELIDDEMADAVTVYGTPEMCREKIDVYRAAGITLPIIFPLYPGFRSYLPNPKARDGIMQIIDSLGS